MYEHVGQRRSSSWCRAEPEWLLGAIAIAALILAAYGYYIAKTLRYDYDLNISISEDIHTALQKDVDKLFTLVANLNTTLYQRT